MALKEITLFGERDKVKQAIDRLKAFEPPEGYYLAFSGGKDSQTIYHLAQEAGVKFDAHYNVTGIDPPELVYFIRENYPDVRMEMYKESMWKLILKNSGPPTRLMRYCCKELKERGGEGRFCVTGVRWEESIRRKNTRDIAEFFGESLKNKILLNDNDEARKMMENCTQKGKLVLNPIIDWTEQDVWEYLNSRDIKHCKLYDEGQKRLGCIGCPNGNTKGMEEDFERYPKFKAQYIRTFDKLVELRKEKGLKTIWETGQDVYDWWVYGKAKEKQLEGQEDFFDMS